MKYTLNKGLESMKCQKYFGSLLYLGLLTCALVYVKNSADEYRVGRTLYSDTQQIITISDLPTITIKFPSSLKYGENFIIQMISFNEEDSEFELVTILENQTIKVFFEILFFKVQVKRLDTLGSHKISMTLDDELNGKWQGSRELLQNYYTLIVKFKELPTNRNYTSWDEVLEEFSVIGGV